MADNKSPMRWKSNNGRCPYLIRKGFIKVKNFTGNPGKLRKIHYLLTEKGIEEKFRLLKHFLQIKEVEYNKLKQEMEKIGDCP